jgi:hypothetical protein
MEEGLKEFFVSLGNPAYENVECLHIAFASFAHTYSIPRDLESSILNFSRKTEEKTRNSVRTARVSAEYKPP